MQNIWKISITAIVLGSLVACSTGANEKKGDGDKKAQLEKLRNDKTKLEADIKKLEDEIAKSDPASQERIKLVSAAPVTVQDFTHYIDLQGRVDADEVVNVTPRGMAGQVKEIYVKKGDMVKKGQLLLKLDDAVMLQQVSGLNTQIDYAKNIYNRQKNLWDQGIGTEVQLITAKNNVDALEKQLATVKESWNTSFVYAPISGLADVVDVKQGEIFSGISPTGPQLRIVNSSQMKVVTEVPENYASLVQIGSHILIVIPDISKDSIPSTIATIGASISPTSRGFITEAKLPAKSGYRINQVAMIKIKDYSAPKAISVPINVVQSDETGKYVYVMVKEGDASKARKKKVVIGSVYNGAAEIKSGLTPADQIITDGYQSVYDGQVITTDLTK